MTALTNHETFELALLEGRLTFEGYCRLTARCDDLHGPSNTNLQSLGETHLRRLRTETARREDSTFLGYLTLDEYGNETTLFETRYNGELRYYGESLEAATAAFNEARAELGEVFEAHYA